MHATLPLLLKTEFPALRRRRLETLQVNLGYVCNQTCVHCHVNAGPKRTESMTKAIVTVTYRFQPVARIPALPTVYTLTNSSQMRVKP